MNNGERKMKHRRFIWNPLRKPRNSSPDKNTQENQKPLQEASEALRGESVDYKAGANEEIPTEDLSRTNGGNEMRDNEASIQHTNQSQNGNLQSFNRTTSFKPKYIGLVQNVNHYYRTSVDSTSQSVYSSVPGTLSPRGRRNSDQSQEPQRPSTPVYRHAPCKYQNLQVAHLREIPDMMEYVRAYQETLYEGSKLLDIIFLFNPSSRVKSHKKIRCPPISVGDVGFFDSRGGFDTQFNVLDNEINKDNTYFQPPGLVDFKEYLSSQGRDIEDILDYQTDKLIKGGRKRSICVNMRSEEYRSERMAEFIVGAMNSPCASVYMPHAVECISIRTPFPFFFEDFMKLYGTLWADFARPPGVGQTKGQPVCVIREVHRAPVWATVSAVVPESGESAKVSQPDPARDVLVWSDFSGDSLCAQAGPPVDCLVDGKAEPPRECIAVMAWVLQPPSQFSRSMSGLTSPFRSSLGLRRGRAASLNEVR